MEGGGGWGVHRREGGQWRQEDDERLLSGERARGSPDEEAPAGPRTEATTMTASGAGKSTKGSLDEEASA